MGITGGNAIEQALIGSNTIDVSKEVKIFNHCSSTSYF
jgi:hypothetical protein